MAFGGVEALLVPWYRQNVSARVVTETPFDLESQVPLLRVVGVGGWPPNAAAPNRFRLVRWVVHAFAVGDPATAALAEEACSQTLAGLRGVALPGAQVNRADCSSLPSPVIYVDPRVRQYVASYSAYVLLD